MSVQGRRGLTACACTEEAGEGAGVEACTVTLAGDNSCHSRSRRTRLSETLG